SPQQTRAGEVLDYGLGFGLGRHAGRREVSHSGAQARVSTLLYLLPDQGIVVVLLCNLERVRLLPLARRLGEIVLEGKQ
ncbi:MAG: serine hydrolase, partial [Planctomycetes bacterium]|nr:serine hydrolase [Planctomycetota bacterium]